MKTLVYSLLILCILFSAPYGAGAASPVTVNVALDSIYYDYIEKLAGMGYIKSLPSGAKPYSRLLMARWTLEALAAAEQKAPPAYLAAQLAELQAGLAPEIAALSGEGVPESVKLREVGAWLGYLDADRTSFGYNAAGSHIAARWQQLNQNNNGYRYGDGANMILRAELSGLVGHEVAVAATPRVSLDKDQDGKASVDSLYVKTRLGIFGLEFGKQAMFWGQGATGSLVLGNNAAPFTSFKVNLLEPYKLRGILRFLGQANFTLFYGQMEGDRWQRALANGENMEFDHAGLLGLRADFAPGRNFTFGLARVSMLGGKGNGLSRSDWKNWLTGKNAETPDLDRWNDVAGLDFRYRLPGLQIYGEIYGEDQAGFFPSHRSYRGGLYLPRLTRDGSWDAQVEFVKTRNNGWNDNMTYRNGWTYRGDILSDAMGADARKIYARLRYFPKGGEEVFALHLQRTDYQRSTARTAKNNELWLSYDRKINKSLRLEALAGFADFKNTGLDADSYFLLAGLRWLY